MPTLRVETLRTPGSALGDPTVEHGTDYALCVYDRPGVDAALEMSANMPGGIGCGDRYILARGGGRIEDPGKHIGHGRTGYAYVCPTNDTGAITSWFIGPGPFLDRFGDDCLLICSFAWIFI